MTPKYRWGQERVFVQAVPQLEGATKRAIENYENVQCSQMELLYGIHKMDVGVRFSESVLDGHLGETRLLLDDDENIVSADILLRYSTEPEEREAIITHELGHALGFGHSNDESSTMFHTSETTFISRDLQVGLCNYQQLVDTSEWGGGGCSYTDNMESDAVSILIICILLAYLSTSLKKNK